MSVYMLWLYTKKDIKLEHLVVIEDLLGSYGNCKSFLELQLVR